ncbi:MAG: roadblock/LC7 domain-containing protein [bacterium]|nr:roadblock/LC7 domain-containing protein [candidate division TA06 bacterium]MDO9392330.1 roadblock/LC7 domain-containing protein [bacterium]
MPVENLNVFEDDFWSINELLNQLLKNTNSLAVLLIDKAGQLITTAGDISQLDTTSFASLSAADFAATSQLAMLVGEKEFSTLFHQGEKQNIYVASIESRVMLAVIFDQRTTLGLVRVRTKQTVAELIKMFQAIFAKLEESPQPPPLSGSNFGSDFASEAESELDNLFK